MLKMQTVTLVKVMAVHGTGVAPVGFVDVQPMVNQMTGDRVAVPHGTIYGLPYVRLQGGANAVICDPAPGDIGLCAFASRDISSVKSNKAVSNPGSQRTFDWADGIYLGGCLNISPTQYLLLDGSGITLHSGVAVTVSAPHVTIGNATTIDGKVFLNHTHGGVQTGSGTTGPVS